VHVPGRASTLAGRGVMTGKVSTASEPAQVRAVPHHLNRIDQQCCLLSLFYRAARDFAREREGEAKSASYADEFRIIALSRYRAMT
jgi:hypothetical protein